MRTVLIAHKNVQYASTLGAVLSEAGYRTILCPGPWPPAMRCIRCDVGYCPLTEGADLMIYDPDMEGRSESGNLHLLALDTVEAHPDVPLLLAWPADVESDGAARTIAQNPTIKRASNLPEELLQQVLELVGPAHDAYAYI